MIVFMNNKALSSSGLEELVAGNTTKKHWWPENSLFFTGGSRDPRNNWCQWPTRWSLVAPGFFSGRLLGATDTHHEKLLNQDTGIVPCSTREYEDTFPCRVLLFPCTSLKNKKVVSTWNVNLIRDFPREFSRV